ncbi:MAG TPA: hypothetical protein VF747_06705 [Blastocatellia bacterium]
MKKSLTAALCALCFIAGATLQHDALAQKAIKDPNSHFFQIKKTMALGDTLPLPIPRQDVPVRVEVSITHLVGDNSPDGLVPVPPILLRGLFTQDSFTQETRVYQFRDSSETAFCHSPGAFEFLDCGSAAAEVRPDGPTFTASASLRLSFATHQLTLVTGQGAGVTFGMPADVMVNFYY